MARQKLAPQSPSRKSSTDAAPSPAPTSHLPSSAAIRETIESVVIAFILAFLFRTFEAEAFVIPTGSMATTLMGRHKDLNCPKCGSPYQISASEEVSQEGVRGPVAPRPVESGTCPMCHYTADLGPGNPQNQTYTSYNGDRIIVSKFAYQISDPQRWDVVVFHYPGDAQTNYIKRLVGLPGETVRIQDGDIWTRSSQDGRTGANFVIARKPPEKLLAMLQPVFDNDYMPQIAEFGWPARWQADATAGATGGWSTDDQTSFRVDGTNVGQRWLRYHHLVPSLMPWREVESGRSAPQLEPTLITDFVAYDTGQPSEPIGMHWVGDLALECTVEVQKPTGSLILELCKGGRRFQCRFELATGKADLSISGPDMAKWKPSASTRLCGAGKHHVRFTNCDDQLLLWVDNSVVSFDQPTTYSGLANVRPEVSDLAPAGIAAEGAEVRVSQLRLMRDIYYLAMSGGDVRHFARDVTYPSGRVPAANEIAEYQGNRYVEFALQPGQFFVLGDNSAKSKDSRLWGTEHWVNRELLIGKALFIYWPHSWNEIRTPFVDIPLPYYPNFSRMGLVR